MKTRNELIDLLKGFAILLVVLGHSVQYSVSNFDHNWLFRIIYAFHMPLFMFLSGFVALSSFDGSIRSLSKRFQSLIIPFFCWFLITDLLSTLLQLSGIESPIITYHPIISLLQSPSNGGLWFLWELFQNFFLLFLVMLVVKKRSGIIICCIAIFLTATGEIKEITVPFFDIQFAGWNLLFFSLGYLAAQFEYSWKQLIDRFGILFLALFTLFVSVWIRHTTPSIIFDLPPYLRTFGYYFYRYATPIFGIISSFYLFSKWKLPPPVKRSLIYLGGTSLGIYAIHFYFVALAESIFIFDHFSKIVVTALFALILSLISLLILKKSSWLAYFLLGKSLNK